MIPNVFLVFRLAMRELRNSLKHFRILFICLVLGVASVAIVQSLSKGITDSIRYDGRYILGGDVALRTLYQPVSKAQMNFLRTIGPVSVTMETRAMARRVDGSKSILVDLKAVDPFYPLYGTTDFVDENDKPIMFKGDKGEWRKATPQDIVLPESIANFEAGKSLWGVAVAEEILQRLDLHIGDTLKLGEQNFRIRGIIDHEPDRLGSPKFSISPRIMMSYYTIDDTGLAKKGSQLYYDHRLILPMVKNLKDLEAVKNKIVAAYPKSDWQGRTFLDAAPGMRKAVKRLNVFLTLMSLTSLLIGGIGIANAVAAYLQRKYNTIACFKCVGANHKLIFWIYFLQIFIISIPAILLGVALGAAIPQAIAPLLTDRLSLSNKIGFYPDILCTSALFGFLILSMFIIWPVAKACKVRVAELFRSRITSASGIPAIKYIVSIIILVEALGLLLFNVIDNHRILLYFIIFSVISLAVFAILSFVIKKLAKIFRKQKNPAIRMAIANLYRPSNTTTAVLMSMGFAMAVMVMIAMIETNFKMALQQDVEKDTPAFYFMDIQGSDIDDFKTTINTNSNAYNLKLTPTLRGHVIKAKGEDAKKSVVREEYSWVVRGDRAFTYVETLPPHNTIIEGEWWPKDYEGEQLVSISHDVALALDLNIGDTLTMLILGMEVTAKVSSIRQVQWNSFTMNFAIIFSPKGQLDGAPATYIGTVQIDKEHEFALQNELANKFPSVTSIRVREVLNTAQKLTGLVGQAVRLGASVTIIIALLVLQGSILSGQRQRLYDAVILKVLGVTKWRLGQVFLIEYGVLSLVVIIVASILGCGLSYGIYSVILEMPWSFSLVALLETAILCVILTLSIGYWNIRNVLSYKTANFLRTE